jgi:hypothetical protein
MNTLKAIVLVLAMTTILCNFESSEFSNVYESEGPEGFLKMLVTAGGSPIVLSNCLDDPIYVITNKKVDPAEIVKGQSIKIKVAGAMKVDTKVQKLHLDTYYNGGIIYQDNVDKKNELVPKGGKYIYEYEASVPTFTPSGKWQIFLYLVNSENVNISCLKAEFSMS